MRLFCPASVLVTLSLCLELFLPRLGSADIFFTLENPVQNQSVSGIGLISGWAFSSVANARVTVRYQIDDLASGEIPCCVDRGDVAKHRRTSNTRKRSAAGLACS